MRHGVLLVLLLALALPAAADSGAEPTRAIGMGLKSAVETFGLPQSMFSFRGSEESRDDVVFYYYADHMYLFWYKDKIWQVRYDRRSNAVVHGVSLGMSRQEVEAAVPERPLVENGDSLYFDLAGALPIRVRLVFADGTLSDIYVFRSDF